MDKLEYDFLLSNLQTYLTLCGIDTRKLFRCINPDHIDNNASMKYFDDGKVYCFGCGASYNLIDCISILENLDKKNAFKKAIDMFCFNKNYKAIQLIEKPKTKEMKSTKEKDYSKAYNVWRKNYKENIKAQEYFISRGFDNNLAKQFRIGFNTFIFGKMQFNAIIIPTSNNYFTARSIDENSSFRYYKPTGNHTEIFNKEVLFNDSDYCVINEGEFDALSFESIGVNAIALSGVTHLNKFLELDIPKEKTYILALDNDNAGNLTTNSLIEYFEINNISYEMFYTTPYKDANELFIKEKINFCEKINKIIEKIAKKQEKNKNFDEEM